MEADPNRNPGAPAPGGGAAPIPRPVVILCVVAALNYIALAIVYVGLDNFFDYVEPGLVSVAWLVARGEPMYTGPDSAAQYNFMYGPVLFLVNAWAMKLLGPSLATSKVAGALAAALSVLFAFEALRKPAGLRCAAAGAGALAFMYFLFWPFATFIARADAIIVGFVALGLWGSLRENKLAAAAVVAIGLGAAVNVKVHSAAYFLPLLVLLLQRHGLLVTLVSGVGAVAVMASPFVLVANVSLKSYLQWLDIAAHHGLLWDTFLSRIRHVTLYLLLPATAVLLATETPLEHLRRSRWYLAAWAVGAVAVMVISSKAGSSRVHLAPLSIPLAYWMTLVLRDGYAWPRLIRMRARAPRIGAWVSLTLFGMAVLTIVPVNVRMGKLIAAGQRSNAAVEDIEAILARHPGRSVAMGYGSTARNYLTWYRPVLVFKGHPYPVEQSAIVDLEGAGRPIPASLVEELGRCSVDLWLIPKGDEPFVMNTVLGPTPLFGERFRAAFLANYRLESSSAYFDLWVCDRKAS